MNSIIFILCKPAEKSKQSAWNDARNEILDAKFQTKDIEEMSEGIWLIHEEKSFQHVGQAIAAAESANCSYKIFITRDAIHWNRTFEG